MNVAKFSRQFLSCVHSFCIQLPTKFSALTSKVKGFVTLKLRICESYIRRCFEHVSNAIIVFQAILPSMKMESVTAQLVLLLISFIPLLIGLLIGSQLKARKKRSNNQ